MVALVASCGHASAGAGDGGPADADAESCDRLFAAVSGASAHSHHLGMRDPPVIAPAGLVSHMDCSVSVPDDVRAHLQAAFRQQCLDLLGACGTGVTTEWIDDCAAVLSQVPCGGSLPDACAFPPPGTLGAGASCSLDLQCASGVCFSGQCSEPLSLGAGCVIPGCNPHQPPGYAVCVPGTACQGGAAPSMCTGICVSSPPVNATALGEPCDDTRGPHCTAPASCIDGRCLDGAGQPCALDDECVAGTDCPAASSGTSSTCQACANGVCTTPVGLGGACQLDAECGQNLRCSSGTCVPTTPDGSPCASLLDCAYPYSVCNSEHRCQTVDVGVAWPRQPCCTDCQTDCAIDICPDGSGGAATCPALAEVGQPCGAGVTCGPYATCQDGVCAWPPASTCSP